METDFCNDEQAMRECFRKISEKISGIHVERGNDGTIWLMPDDGIDVMAVCWKSIAGFLFGAGGVLSVFRYLERMAKDGESDYDDYKKLASLNGWMKQLRDCSSPEEMLLALACIG